jgi:hypothetical protein
VERSGRRILLAVQPRMLEGALARLLSATHDDEVVQVGRRGLRGLDGGFDAAVVSDELPYGARADVVITLPDTRGGGGTATIRSGDVVREVSIRGAGRVVDLLEQYVPHR